MAVLREDRGMREEIGQLLTMGLPGPRLDERYREAIGRLQPGGFIFFARNLESPAQVRSLCDELRDLCERPPILTIDQEGGRVSRLRKIGATPPSGDELRRTNDPALCREHGALTARLLGLFGMNLNLAPVVDMLLEEGAENSLLNRCYGSGPEQAIRLAGAFLDAMQEEGVAGTIKHFPGYSLCTKDPHAALPLVDRSREELEACELLPFRQLAKRAACVMIGHAVYPHLDPTGTPSSLSPAIIAKLLREDVGFDGLVMTDDLEMGAISGAFGVGETVRRAITASNDLLLFCHQLECVEMAVSTLNKMPAEQLRGALDHMASFKQRLSPPPAWEQSTFEKINTQIADLRERVITRSTQA